MSVLARKAASHNRLLTVLAIVLPTILILIYMSGVVDRVTWVDGFPWVDIDPQWPSMFLANTPTGGDMGAHVVLPQVLRDDLLPSGRILGWSSDWYAGYPVFYFYFPLPALFTVLLDVFIPYGVAFKVTTILGLALMPSASYYIVRSSGFARPVAAMAAMFGTMFVFMESFAIFGGNIKSTLAGEFSFSWSLALSLFYLGTVIKNAREGRGFTLTAGVLLALTALSHIVTTIVVVVVSLPLLLRRRATWGVVSSWIVGFAFAAFWALPVLFGILSGLSTDMGWNPLTGIRGSGLGNAGTPFVNEFIPIAVLGAIGMIWTLYRREDVRVLLTMTLLPFPVYLLIAEQNWTILYNARLLPYWFLGFFLFAGIATGLAITRLARWLPNRHENTIAIGGLTLAVLITFTLIGVHDIPGWVNWNYEGYEGKADYPELEALMTDISALPDGRVMWEYNKDVQQRYGTPMALMLIPYWSDGHTTMEGVFFESSLTTPFHFLNQSEMSRSPSQPVRWLSGKYNTFALERGIPHMALYNIDYYVTQTEEMTGEANRLGLEPLVVEDAYSVFALPDAGAIDIAQFEPMVYDGEEEFVDVAVDWYNDLDRLDHWVVAEGPTDADGENLWQTFEEIGDPRDLGAEYDTTGARVSDVVIDDHGISFTTNAVGVPHLVKTSYFPNWTATGADGPYRAAPSLMVVVPTSEQVSLEFSRTWTENLGMVLTILALAYAASRVLRSRASRREMAAGDEV